MRVLFDHQVYKWYKFGGVSRYFTELFLHLPQYGVDTMSSVLYTENEYFPYGKSQFIRGVINKIPVTQKIVNGMSKVNNLKDLKFGNYDIFHPTQYYPYFLKKCKKPMVVTIYDMTQEKFPENFPDLNTDTKLEFCNKAEKVIAISESTKKDLVFIFGIKPEKITVIHLACSIKKPQIQALVDEKEKILLYVGFRRYYKNFDRFLDALKEVFKTLCDYNAICVGGQEFNEQELKMISDKKLTKKIQQIDLSENELISMYSRASMLIYPSLYEGFGIPLLEAMNCNCPLVISDIPCFREVAGGAAEYFDPFDYFDMAEKIIKVALNINQRSALINKGSERKKDFSWPATIEKTAKLYKSIFE